MHYLKYLALLAVLAIAIPATTATAHAQVAVGIGVGGPGYVAGYDGYDAPVCEYGYYGYAPYACAPYGYYGPSWFSGGFFIGAGPWFRGGYGYGYRGVTDSVAAMAVGSAAVTAEASTPDTAADSIAVQLPVAALVAAGFTVALAAAFAVTQVEGSMAHRVAGSTVAADSTAAAGVAKTQVA